LFKKGHTFNQGSVDGRILDPISQERGGVFYSAIFDRDSERIPRHAYGGISERTSNNRHLPYLEDSLHLGAGSFKISIAGLNGREFP